MRFFIGQVKIHNKMLLLNF